jgi:hypothetical protein
MHNIYTVTIFENGRFTWKVTKRAKTVDDYRKEDGWLAIFSILVLSIFAAKALGV